MLRVVRTPDGEIKIDPTGKCAGRGAYVCNEPSCVEKCVKKRIFDKVFGVRLSDEDYASIAEQYVKKP
ncbi:MAG TPA: YlxR family protein [Candidatus Ornithoclostridium faecigallinarum]|nr:YlxR family protein [Candidatus Ornithoclostridium faecigallinarum]